MLAVFYLLSAAFSKQCLKGNWPMAFI